MILWTIRHTKPYNPNDVCYGRLNFDVSPTFEEESQGAINAILNAKAKPSALYSSPLLRCTKLANKVSKELQLPLQLKEEIIEVNFGDWEGVKLTDVPKEQMNAWANNLRGYRFPNGESFYDVDKRVESFLNTLDQNGEFLWVSHAGVIASLQHFACGLPDSEFVEGAFSYSMVTRFEFTKNKNGLYVGTFKKIHDGIQMAPLKIS